MQCHGATVKKERSLRRGLGALSQGIKLELFIFDTFPWAQRPALLEVRRDEEFAPVKNAPGAAADSPDTARAAVLQLHTK